MDRGKRAVVVVALCLVVTVGVAPVYLAGCASKTHPDHTVSLEKAVPADLAPATPAPYRVASTKDVSIAGRSRTELRVVIQDRNASGESVHAALLEAANNDGADKVMVFAYWPGDDTTSMYTAGRLEWGKDGRAWDGSDYIGPDGRFDQD